MKLYEAHHLLPPSTDSLLSVLLDFSLDRSTRSDSYAQPLPAPNCGQPPFSTAQDTNKPPPKEGELGTPRERSLVL